MIRHEINLEFFTCGETYHLTPEIETTLFRIAQEGLTNIIKHSGASHASVSLCFSSDQIDMEIRDDGHGFNVGHILEPGAERAWGLVGIRERVTLAGGRLDVQSSVGKGTLIRVAVPHQQLGLETLEHQESTNGSH
jgi:signal transduction histidine kinase